MTNESLFDRVSQIVNTIESEKTAAMQEEKRGMKDPGGYEGPSSHPSAKSDEDELETPPEGAQSADNTKTVKEDIPESVDQQPDATPGNVPSSDDTQQGQGVDKAKATGEDPSTEKDYQGKPTGDKREGDMGGTTHPADGSYGDKYAADRLKTASDEDLLKMAAELGNAVVADIANDHFAEPQRSQGQSVSPKQAAEAGAAVAQAAEEITPDILAAAVLENQVKAASHQADLVASHLAYELANLQKQAEEEAEAAADEDPTGGMAEGEDYGTEPADEAPGADAGMLEGAGAGADAAMAPDAGGGADAALLAAMSGDEPGADAGAPPELAELGGDEGLQQLAMALLELGIDPEELAAAASGAGAKIASLVTEFKQSGKFRVEAPQNPQQKRARDYMRGYVKELRRRNG